MKIDYQSLEKKIKVSFKNKNLLIKSLTHKSFNKEFEFVSINPSSVQGPGRISGTAKLLISTLNKKFPPLIKSSVSVVRYC